MICSKCGATNSDNSRFCEKCGNRIEELKQPEVVAPVKQEPVKQPVVATPIKQEPIPQVIPSIQTPQVQQEMPQVPQTVTTQVQSRVEMPVQTTQPTIQQPVQPPVAKPKKKGAAGIVIAVILSFLLIFFGGGFAVYHFFLADGLTYSKALELYNEGEYEEALEEFSTIVDYKDSQDKINEINYCFATDAYCEGDYALAYEMYTALGDFWDSMYMAEDSNNILKYSEALALEEAGDYDSAIEVYSSILSYENSQSRIDCINSAKALGLLEEYAIDTWVLDCDSTNKLNMIDTYESCDDIILTFSKTGDLTFEENGSLDNGTFIVNGDILSTSQDSGDSVDYDILTAENGEIYLHCIRFEKDHYFCRRGNNITVMEAFPELLEEYKSALAKANEYKDFFIESVLTGDTEDETYTTVFPIFYCIAGEDEMGFPLILVQAGTEYILYHYTVDEGYVDFEYVTQSFKEEWMDEMIKVDNPYAEASELALLEETESASFSGTYYDIALAGSGDVQPRIKFNEDGTYDMDVNLYEGMGKSKGTYTVVGSQINCFVSEINFQGFVGDDIGTFSFQIDGDVLVYLGEKMGTTDPENIFQK